LSGADLVHDVGFIDGAMTGSLQMVTTCDEIISYVKRLLRGIEVTPETLASKVIRSVGPGGHYLTSDHTLEHFKDQFWFPRLMDRTRRAEWEAKGSLSMGERVQRFLIEILDHHRPVPLDPNVQKHIDEILAQAEAR